MDLWEQVGCDADPSAVRGDDVGERERMMEVGGDNNRRDVVSRLSVCSLGGWEEIVRMCISHDSFTPGISYCEFDCR